MAQNWTSLMAHSARTLSRVFRTQPRAEADWDDADARRNRVALDAIRARFPDHS